MFKKLLVAGFIAGVCATASAGTIVGASGAVINSGGPGYGDISASYNQSGLSSGYTSGVSDFATYIGTNPLHTPTWSGYEWFSNDGITSASVTYDLGSAWSVSGLALWNEEVAGIGQLNLFYSLDGIAFNSLAAGLAPTDNPLSANYGAQVFAFTAANARYIRFDMSDCPQGSGTLYCAIGEVAFDANPVSTDVPEPATLGLFGLGLAGLAALRRRRRA